MLLESEEVKGSESKEPHLVDPCAFGKSCVNLFLQKYLEYQDPLKGGKTGGNGYVYVPRNGAGSF